MILIIAEKPSLGRNIAQGIASMSGATQLTSKTGFMEGNGYIVTWAFGHLFSLCDIEDYTGVPDGAVREDGSARWTMDNLPCFPSDFRFQLKKDQTSKKIDAGVQKQFNLISTLCNRQDVDTIVNAGDADREGEIIVRLCIQNALKTQKSIKRLWLPDQTPQTVAQALTELKDDAEYDSLANEGFARTFIDWLYGVNLTRYATLKSGKLLRVGRVIIPIVKAIYDRDKEISNFVPGHYLAIVSKEKTKDEVVELTSKSRFEENEKDKADAFCRQLNDSKAIVTSVKNKKDKLFPGKLYSLSKLQNVLSKRFKMSMTQSLALVQKLYESGYLTYPRTDTEYMATAEKDKVRKILKNCKDLGYPVQFKDSKTIFDDSKIESHSAITPTFKIPKKEQLSEDEFKVYSTVFKRFIAVFCAEDCIVSKREITITVGPSDQPIEEFVLKGNVIIEPGWTKYDTPTLKDKVLPNLEKGDEVNIHFNPIAKETSPPKHYTVETLNNYLKNPFREEKAQAQSKQVDAADVPDADQIGADDADDYKAIFEGLELGTEATRTGIIDNARKSHYIQLKGEVYSILPDGEFLIEFLTQMQIVMDKYKTSQLGQALKKVFHGTMTIDESVTMAETEIDEVFSHSNADSPDNTGMFKDVIGQCPKCGKDVLSYGRFYGCSGYNEGCKFSIRSYLCGKTISVANVQQLLSRGRTELIHGFRSKKGNLFDAYLVLGDDGCTFEFPERSGKSTTQKKSAPPLCPLCHKAILRGKSAFGCEGWKEGCTFRVSYPSDDENEKMQALQEALAMPQKGE